LVKEALDTLGNGNLKYIAITHYHLDHSGGNDVLSEKAVSIAAKNILTSLEGRYYHLGPRFTSTSIDSTFTRNFTIHFNGEEIGMLQIPPGHTNSDIFVYFPKSKIVHVHDMVFPDAFPYVDLADRGNVEMYLLDIDMFLSIFTKDVTFISSHGRDYTWDDLKNYREELQMTVDLIRSDIKKGKSPTEIAKSGRLDPWEAWGYGFVDIQSWVNLVYASDNPPKPSICEPLTKTIVEQGIQSAVKQYWDLKRNEGANYNFGESQLNLLGYNLLWRNKLPEAIEIFKINIEAYPNAWNVYDSMGEAYYTLGDNSKAIKYYKKSLKLNPQNQNAKEFLKKLE
jgi:glyoxylase-like metal-dependent hydrolase (beta-lactamase superfamily II)